MGFGSNLKKDFKDAKIYVDANKNPFSKEAREVRKRMIMGLDLETGKPNLEIMSDDEKNARIRNIRDTMEKYNINHPETIKSIEEKIDEINMQLKTVSNKEDRVYLLNQLDHYYDELDRLKNSEKTNKNIDYTK